MALKNWDGKGNLKILKNVSLQVFFACLRWFVFITNELDYNILFYRAWKISKQITATFIK